MLLGAVTGLARRFRAGDNNFTKSDCCSLEGVGASAQEEGVGSNSNKYEQLPRNNT